MKRGKTTKKGNARKAKQRKTAKAENSRKITQDNITAMWESGRSAREKIMAGCLTACALIWTLVFLLDFVGVAKSTGLIVMHGIFALAWIIGAASWILLKRKK